MVLRGDAGVGKTALLEDLSTRASGFRVARVVGIESEMELAFAGLHQLCAPMLGYRDRIPGPQSDALATAFGLSAGEPPDRFLVGLAVLSLLAEVAEEEPVLCLVDDAQWLDDVSARTLAFVARRLLAERVAFVFAIRNAGSDGVFAGLPELVVGGLADADARVLLNSVVTGPVDEQVRDRIVAEMRGNPLALLQLSAGSTPAELAGGYGLPEVMPISDRIEDGFIRQLQPLPSGTRRLLLTAAVEPTGDVALLWRALDGLGVAVDAVAPAEAAGLIHFGTQVRFRHPLIRSAVCRAAAPEELEDAHRTLAAATDPQRDPDRHAWHRAHATTRPDEDVAAELERSADRARSRGGEAAVAAFLARATELTPDPGTRGVRAVAAAEAKFYAAATADEVQVLLAAAAACPLDANVRARSERLRALLALTTGRAHGVSAELLDAATQLAPVDPDLARAAFLDAFSAATFAGRFGDKEATRQVAQAVRAALPLPDSPRPLDLLLDGLATRFADGYQAGVTPLRRALQACAGADVPTQPDLIGLILASTVSPDLWDDEGWELLTGRVVLAARATGGLYALPIALNYQASAHVNGAQFGSAAALLDEADAISDAIGHQRVSLTAPEVAAWQGREARAMELTEASIEAATARRFGRPISLAHHARAVLFNGLGRYPEALAAAELACEHEDPYHFGRSLSELVEAGVRSRDHDAATAAFVQLTQRTGAAGTDWALGIEARSRALLSADAEADSLYRQAVEYLGRTRLGGELARAHLLYGEWLRREGRRVDAREELRTAHEALTAIGADAFAERARRELAATGETVRKRSVDTRNEFTAQEAQIAQLAADGHTNPEIGALLFISPRTVEWHLRKVYTKLGVGSRMQLRDKLPDAASTGAPA